MKTIQMWDTVPALREAAPGENVDIAPILQYFPAEEKKSDATVVILPGGGYIARAEHEGSGYAAYFNSIGMDAFVCHYRVAPNRFPLPLLDARRALRWVRYHAAEYGVDPSKIAIMGSSAGGHLAALTSTYFDPIDYEDEDEIDGTSAMPNATILCYPVCHMPDNTDIAHVGSYENLMGEDRDYAKVSPDLLVSESTPPAFIWATAADDVVNVTNSYYYAAALRKYNIPCEMHIFPYGNHGQGLAYHLPHVAQWSGLMKNWLGEIGWLSR